MKKNIKYFIAGFLSASLIAAIPAAAEFVDAFMNTARINVDGVDRIAWGEQMELGEDWYAPTSINYKDTLYLPLRKISELSGNNVVWNGDTNTVSVTDKLINKKKLVERTDLEGHLWEYATTSALDGSTYLTVTDAERGYTRVYRTASSSVRIKNDAIYFMRLKEHDAMQNQGTIIRLPFDNTPDTQDGEAIIALYPITAGEVIFDGDYVFYAGVTPGNGSHSRITAYNYFTNQELRLDAEQGSTITSLTRTDGDYNSATLTYTYTRQGGNSYSMKTTFDKKTKQFSNPEIVTD